MAIDEVGIPGLVLMEVAGRGVFECAYALHQQAPGVVLVLAGAGNNGGDAVVAARHLIEHDVQVALFVLSEESKASADLRTELAMVSALGLEATWVTKEEAVLAVNRFGDASVVIDGLFGTGLTRPIAGWRSEVIDRVNALQVPVVSVDIPSGVSADTGQVLGNAICADETVTFQFAKLGHAIFPGRKLAGKLHVVDIGIPSSRLDRIAPVATMHDDELLVNAFPPRPADSHKGTYGHLLVVAGMPDRPGAGLLASRAALKSGAGLVTLASDSVTIGRVTPVLDEMMGLTVGDDGLVADAILEALESRTALVIGPSLAPDERLQKLLRRVLENSRVPVVLDAGALAALSTDWKWLAHRKAATVLTPHPKEMARLLGVDTPAVQTDRIAAARHLVQEVGVHVILKGASTIVAGPQEHLSIETGGNPGMATGGTGDVLAGMVGALLAQGVEPNLAAQAGVRLHARAGDLAAQSIGEVSLMASDILRFIPQALLEVA